jgi:hypothetical protein
MYLAEAEEVFGHWRQYPPTYQAVGIIAQMLGWKPPGVSSGNAELTPLPDLTPGPAAAIGKMADLPGPVIVDLDVMREKNKQYMLAIAKRNAAKA